VNRFKLTNVYMRVNFLRSADLILLGAVTVLTVAGIVLMGLEGLRSESIWMQAVKQSLFLVIGFTIFFVFSRLDLRFLRTRSVWVLLPYIVTIVSLLIVLFLGVRVRGAASWFHIGPFTIEPIEFVKISVILLLAKYFSLRHAELEQFRHVFISGAYVGIPVAIAVFQPDMGAAVVLSFIWFGILLFLELPKRQTIFLIGSGVLVAAFAWVAVLAPYQKSRITSFARGEDPQGTGYHARQALIAVGSGGFFGKSFDEPTQASQNFLPESTTDFIFAAFAERFGFAGISVVLGAFAVLIWRIIRIASGATNNFIRAIAAGTALLFFAHAFIHVGMNLGLVPVTGLPMPFMSYGGSHIISGFVLLGILESLRRHQAQLLLGQEVDIETV